MTAENQEIIEPVKIKMDRFSKISELLADFAQLVAHAVYCKGENKAMTSQEISITKDILRGDILEIVDEYIQKRCFYQDAIDEYYKHSCKKLHDSKKEMESKIDFIIKERINYFYKNFEQYLSEKLEKLHKAYMEDLKELKQKINRISSLVTKK